VDTVGSGLLSAVRLEQSGGVGARAAQAALSRAWQGGATRHAGRGGGGGERAAKEGDGGVGEGAAACPR
jgi:hypothetical protein